MTILEQVASLLEAGRIAEIEDIWVSRQTDHPHDLTFFTAVARLLEKTKENDTAEFLLELLDEQLIERGSWDARLQLLESCGLQFLEPERVHAAALDSLARLYPDSPSLEGLLEKTGLHRAISDIPKTFSKIDRLRSLMQFETGAYVSMEGKGAGQVVEVNLQLESFKLALSDRSEIRVGFAAAPKLLRPLPAGHIERRKLEDIEALLDLKREAPGELLILALQGHDGPATAAEIRQLLQGVVDENEWSSWWGTARKHPRVLTSTARGRHTYTWAATEDHALEDVRQSFTEADLEHKLEILRKNANRSQTLTDEMIGALRVTAENQGQDDPAVALQIWYALERLSAADSLARSPSVIAREANAPNELARSLDDKSLRERFYEVCWSERPDGPAIFREALLQEADPRLLSMLAERLRSRDAKLLKAILDDILGHPRRHPAAFVWLAEAGESIPYLRDRNPLRLIRQILDALHQSEFSGHRSRLQKTFETGGGATHLFTRLSEDQAAQAERAVKRAPLDDHLRDSLTRYLHVRFPSLDRTREAPLYATGASIEARQRELEKLQREEIPANRKAIEEARELGDLRENFEYKSARQRHEYLNARLASLKKDLARVRPLDAAAIDLSEARVGCLVDLDSVAGESRSITILGPWESDPDQDIVSYDSDLGQLLLGKRPGDSVVIDGQSWTLSDISPWQQGARQRSAK